MKVETAATELTLISSTVSKVQSPSLSFSILLDNMQESQTTSSDKDSKEKARLKEAEIQLQILATVMEVLTGDKPVLSKDDIIDTTQSSPALLLINLTDSGFEKLKSFLANEGTISGKISITSDTIIITDLSHKTEKSLIRSVSVSSSTVTAEMSLSKFPIDPLILTIGKKSASLNGRYTEFDIDGNGTKENMPIFDKDNFLLAMDKNLNGQIDDGKELFGPSTNNGYFELKNLDSNNDNCIDSSDKEFDNIKLLEFSDTGTQILSSLSARKVESLYLSTSKTSVDLKTKEGELAARITENSVAKLTENKAGVVQHLDFFC